MRSDYILYGIAIICFIVAVYTYTAELTGVTDLYIYTLAVVGIAFLGLGYVARPKRAAITSPATSTLPPARPDVSPKPAQPRTEPKEKPKKASTRKRTRKRRTTRRKKQS